VARIFLALALFALTLNLAALGLGLAIGDLNGISRQWLEAKRAFEEAQRNPRATEAQRAEAEAEKDAVLQKYRPLRSRFGLHSLCGIAAALVTVLVNSVAVTYFVGTSRWCREVVETYQLPQELADRSQQLKRKTFPWAILGIVSILVIVSLGAASDPGANIQTSDHYVTWHWNISVVGVGAIGWAFLAQVGLVGANYEIIEQILALVHQHPQNASPAQDDRDDSNAARDAGAMSSD
jgi:hypothetical protein